jgi:SAM-dependent methyltransferase
VKVAGFLIALLSVGLVAQDRTTPAPPAPRVGQLGKDVGWVPTSQALLDQMLDMASVTSRDYVIDLGSGDGRTVIAAAKRGARALGIEYDPSLVEWATRRAAAEGVGARARFVKADLFESDLSQATVITMYLLPEINLKLRPRLLELAPGTRIVSNTFTMEEWEPDETTSVHGNCFEWCTALLWIVPAKVAGVWRLPQGSMRLTQEFQRIKGSLAVAGSTVPIENSRLRGTHITFTAGRFTYTGTVAGDVIQGTITGAAGDTPWTAKRN